MMRSDRPGSTAISRRRALATIMAMLAGAALPGASAAGTPAAPSAQQPAGANVAPGASVHGSLDAYAGHGVALAWAVLRGGGTDAEVVVRIEATSSYRAVAVAGVDPFSHQATLVVPATQLDHALDVRIARARFADLPRTEWRFYASPSPEVSTAPALMIFYQGVPDTTPEFDDPAKLEAYLAHRIDAVRRGAAK